MQAAHTHSMGHSVQDSVTRQEQCTQESKHTSLLVCRGEGFIHKGAGGVQAIGDEAH